MRTALFLLSGVLFLAGSLIMGKLFTANYPNGPTVATALFLALWLVLTGANMWVGVARAGYSVAEELPIFLLLFGLPAAAAVLLRWKLM